jgi:HEAT repeat protein
VIRRSLIESVPIALFLAASVFSATPSQLPDLLKTVATGAEAEKVKAINQLKELGIANEAVVKALSSQLQSDSAAVRAHAIYTLGALSAPRGIEMALPLMSDPSVDVRHAAIHALHDLKAGPDVILPLIDQAMKESDPAVRMHVLTIAAEIGKPAVPTLVKLLESEESAPWGCIALGAIGSNAAAAVPALTKMLAPSHQPKLRLEAAMTLAAIGPASAPALPELMKILDGKDRAVLPGAIYAVGSIGPPAKSVERKLRELITREDPFTRVIATWAILKMHPDDQEMLADSLPALVTGLINKEARTRAAAAKCLTDLKPRPALAMPAILKVMDGASPEAFPNIIDTVENGGASAVPVLIKALDEQPLRPRIAAILGRIGPDAKEAAPALAGVVEKEKSSAARREALIALGAIGPFASGQVPVIAKVLGDDDSKLRAAACYALGKIGPVAITSKNELRECLKSDDEMCSMAAAWALTRVDPNCPEAAKGSVPCLVKGLFNPDPHIRMEAVNALQTLGAQARDAVPALKKVASDDPQAVIRIAAGKAIKTVEK